MSTTFEIGSAVALASNPTGTFGRVTPGGATDPFTGERRLMVQWDGAPCPRAVAPADLIHAD